MQNDTVTPGRAANGRLRRRRAGVAAALPLLAAGLLGPGLAGCSAAGGDADSRGDGRAATAGWPDAVPRSGLAKGLVLPLEAYMETYPETVTVSRAVLHLETTCMARYGFHVSFPEPGTMPPPGYDSANMARRYGLTDRATAEKLAYGFPTLDRTPPPEPRLSPAETAVLSGKVAIRPGAADAPATYQGRAIPQGGCETEALRKVGADRIDASLSGRLDADSQTRSMADPRVQAVITAWSACMRSSGYTVDNPLDAPKLAEPSAGRSATAADIQVATTDIDCKVRTHLVTTWFTVESALQRQQVEQNQLALQDARARITAAVKAAAAVTG